MGGGGGEGGGEGVGGGGGVGRGERRKSRRRRGRWEGGGGGGGGKKRTVIPGTFLTATITYKHIFLWVPSGPYHRFHPLTLRHAPLLLITDEEGW